MIPELVAAVVGLGVTTSGWVFAYRARGESRDALERVNEEADARRLAESALDAAKARVFDAEARAIVALAEARAARLAEDQLRSELSRERNERMAAYVRLAEMGAPVGAVLVDAAIDELYPNANRDGRPASGDPGDPGAGGGADPELPDDPTDPTGTAADHGR